jgi:hypothetical protein
MAEFDGILPKRQVAGTVLQAVSDLDGQVPPGALPQMLHQLAQQRLHSSIPEVWPISATPVDRRWSHLLGHSGQSLPGWTGAVFGLASIGRIGGMTGSFIASLWSLLGERVASV